MAEHTGKVYFCCSTPGLVATSTVWEVTEIFALPSISPRKPQSLVFLGEFQVLTATSMNMSVSGMLCQGVW
jgi:hypothetical protein